MGRYVPHWRIKPQLYNLLNQYHVTALFAGHTHYDAITLTSTVEWMISRNGPAPAIWVPLRGLTRYRHYKGLCRPYRTESRTLNSLPVGSANMKKGPYLIYPGNNTQMTVLWQVDDSTSSSQYRMGHRYNLFSGKCLYNRVRHRPSA